MHMWSHTPSFQGALSHDVAGEPSPGTAVLQVRCCLYGRRLFHGAVSVPESCLLEDLFALQGNQQYRKICVWLQRHGDAAISVGAFRSV